MSVKRLSGIKSKIIKDENLAGRKERILRIECHECALFNKDDDLNNICLKCIFKNIKSKKTKRYKKVHVINFDLTIEYEKIYPFLSYFESLGIIQKRILKIINLRDKCPYKEFECRSFPQFYKFFQITEDQYLDPIVFYNNINKKFSSISQEKNTNPECQKCIDFIKIQFQIIQTELENLAIVEDFKKFFIPKESVQDDKLFLSSVIKYYTIMFTESYNPDKYDEVKDLAFYGEKERKVPLHTYIVGEFDLFKISIFERKEELEKIYEIEPNYESREDAGFCGAIINNLLQNIEIFKFDTVIKLESLINVYRDAALSSLKDFNIEKSTKEKIGYLTAIRIVRLEKLFPLLIDDFIEEIFLDTPNTTIYINHQKYGRCTTNIRFTTKEIERIKTLFRIYSSKRLDYINPSIKFVMKNNLFYCRFAADGEPVNVNGFSIDIRKLDKNILTIQDLLKYRTLDPSMAAFLYFCILRRINLTAAGETDTGKTTFNNAFDLITPSIFRKIYIENVEESLNQLNFGKHQLKYEADSLDTTIESKYTKSNYIETLLHRTPDIIYLGEILKKEECEAMFHCLAAGLRGFQTIHSRTIDSLINRFLYHFKIDSSCLEDLDLLILLKKDFNQRRVVSISEIDIDNSKNYQREIFNYLPGSEIWKKQIPLYETNTIKKLTKYEKLDEGKFESLMKIYRDIFNTLLNIQKIENKKLVNLFHVIAYYSINSPKGLLRFWEEWKIKNISRKLIDLL